MHNIYLKFLCILYFFPKILIVSSFLLHKVNKSQFRLRDYSSGIDIGFNAGKEKIAALNAELLAQFEGDNLVGIKTGGVKPIVKCSNKIMNEKPIVLAKLLEREGCVSIANVIDQDTSMKLLEYIRINNDINKRDVLDNKVPFNDRYGGVNCRGLNGIFGTRQDMYLPLVTNANDMNNDIVFEAIKTSLTSLKLLLDEIVTENGMLHEISSIIANPGSPRQCIHADTIVLPCPQYPNAFMEPLYTFFIALQDVTFEMGHTIFLPRTHTPEAHLLWNTNQKQKEKFISCNKAVESNLKCGDVVIFDSRILHCGTANTSNLQRVLFYFTLSKSHNWPLPNGLHGSNSIRIEDRLKWCVKDLLV